MPRILLRYGHLVTELPIACSLEPEGREERRRAWQRLIEEALLDKEVTPSGVRLVFSRAAEVERHLEDLVELERQCCAFARWTVMQDPDYIVLRVDGDAQGAAAIQALFRP